MLSRELILRGPMGQTVASRRDRRYSRREGWMPTGAKSAGPHHGIAHNTLSEVPVSKLRRVIGALALVAFVASATLAQTPMKEPRSSQPAPRSAQAGSSRQI